jgi:hypothetical protein
MAISFYIYAERESNASFPPNLYAILFLLFFSALKIFQTQLQQWDAARRCDQKWKRVEVRAFYRVQVQLLGDGLFFMGEEEDLRTNRANQHE